uniref:Alpha/beta hydrolase n=1 Tax=Phenylobacterium glaciei TaxID=2803784 RepID=A0A974SAY1_9CAUL|nr:alpha/beta hydrolase [Phenylobacterium glaciei]
MIHGGCWLADLPGTELMDYVSDDLRKDGVAVWNLEYRRIGHDGGGWPGTFTDVAAGADHVRELAKTYRLDLNNVVFAGHSAGGHLALWASKASPCAGKPLPAEGRREPGRDHRPGRLSRDRPRRVRRTGHHRRPDRSAVPQDQGSLWRALAGRHAAAGRAPGGDLRELDPIVPPRFGAAYAASAKAAGDPVTALNLKGAGHFELIDPKAPAWAVIKAQIKSLLD